jgi:hypothetical protein
MFDLLSDELIVLGIAGAIMVVGCWTETLSPFTLKLVGFIVGVFMLGIALIEIGTRHA